MLGPSSSVSLNLQTARLPNQALCNFRGNPPVTDGEQPQQLLLIIIMSSLTSPCCRTCAHLKSPSRRWRRTATTAVTHHNHVVPNFTLPQDLCISEESPGHRQRTSTTVVLT